MENLKRTHYCVTLNTKNINQEVVVCGWVQKQRDLGQLIFVDLRDRTGIVQLAFDETTNKEIFEKAFKLRAEFVLLAKGIVKERSSKNLNIPTGEVEIQVNYLEVLAVSETPPFEICENTNAREELRLKYRYLDLRRPDVQKNIIARHKILKIARDFFDQEGFLEIETPILIKSTPEGARDYLVPSRIFPGNFFALPQSPQLYKQLTMIAGFDRYFQIAKCFRDEDLRADRQPEFTQIDLEMSFVQEEDIMQIIEKFIAKAFKEALNINLDAPFKRMSYSDAIKRFGSDKPDLRFGMEICDLSEILQNTEFKVFAGALQNKGKVCAINAKNASDIYSRKEIDKLTEWVKTYGAQGLAFCKINANGEISSSYEKFLSQEEIKNIRSALNAENNDILFIVANQNAKVVYESLGALRCEIAKKLNLLENKKPNLLWITDFPLFEFDQEENRCIAMHHPFTAPHVQDLGLIETEPLKVRARAYDLVLNGNEIGGGSIRINDLNMQSKMFKALGFTAENAEERFGFLLEALKFGAPPHGGFAFGLDRLLMIMLNCESIREVIAFPKISNSSELMSLAPSKIDEKQLDELNLKTCIQID